MPRRLLLLVKVLIAVAIGCAFSGFAQTPTPIPITGNLGSILGYGQPYAGMSIDLVNCPSPAAVTGYFGIVQTGYQLQANSAGLINSTIWPNDLITCNGTTGSSQYYVTYMVNGQPAGTPVCYQPVSSIGVWNINTLQPIACTLTPPNPQDASYQNLNVTGFFSAVNGSFTGLLQVASLQVTQLQLGTTSQNCGAGLYQTGLTDLLVPICSSLPSSTGMTALTGPVTASGPGSAVSIITPTGVSAGSYTNMNCTVNAAGQLTSCVNGSVFSAGHDLSGTLSSQTVVGLEGVPFCSGYTPVNADFVQYTTGGTPNPCYGHAAVVSSNAIIAKVSFTSCTFADDGATASACVGTQSWGTTLPSTYYYWCQPDIVASLYPGSCGNLGDCVGVSFNRISQTTTDFTYAIAQRLANPRGNTVNITCWATN
jgi:hypothetical protein